VSSRPIPGTLNQSNPTLSKDGILLHNIGPRSGWLSSTEGVVRLHLPPQQFCLLLQAQVHSRLCCFSKVPPKRWASFSAKDLCKGLFASVHSLSGSTPCTWGARSSMPGILAQTLICWQFDPLRSAKDKCNCQPRLPTPLLDMAKHEQVTCLSLQASRAGGKDYVNQLYPRRRQEVWQHPAHFALSMAS
jgi:hypothetical protein